MRIHFHGHSCFELSTKEHSVLIDPFLSGNPVCKAAPGDVNPDFILLTHAHSDHFGDTADIARRTNALVISTFEVASLCAERGAPRIHGMHLGGQANFPFGRVRVTPALHGSGVAGGHAAGFIFTLGGFTVYHAGDTALFGDMRLLGDLESIDIAMLPIGSNYTMNIDDAVLAVQMLRPKAVIPMHYNTFPAIVADPQDFARKVHSNTNARAHVLEPNSSVTAEELLA